MLTYRAPRACRNACVYNDDNKRAIVAAGAIPLLIDMLRGGAAASAVERACGALRWVCRSGSVCGLDAGGRLLVCGIRRRRRDLCATVVEHRVAVAAAGAVPLLVEHLASAAPGVVENAAGAARARRQGSRARGRSHVSVGSPLVAGALWNIVVRTRTAAAACFATDTPLSHPIARRCTTTRTCVCVAGQLAWAPHVLVCANTCVCVCVCVRVCVCVCVRLWRVFRACAQKLLLASHGALPALARVLATGAPGCQERAAGAVRDMCALAAVRGPAAAAGVIAPLTALLASGTPGAVENAVGALWVRWPLRAGAVTHARDVALRAESLCQ